MVRLGSVGRVESRGDRRARARALAAFFAAGATVSFLALLLPGWDEVHRPGIGATVVAAGAGAAMLFLLADRMGRVAIHLMTASGTVLIALCQILAGGGSPTATYAMLYIWVVLHSALFHPTIAVAGHLGLTTLAHVVALLWLGDVAGMAPQLALTVGTQVVAALVVGSLARSQRGLADTDALTGLGNRRVVDRKLEWALARSRRTPDVHVCVALLDLDGFKAFNDELGHMAGDRVLVEAAAQWSGLVRATDTLARTGGDEFVLVLDGGIDTAREIVERMVQTTPAGLACSAGVACWDGTEPPETLLERADRALYAAKAGGSVAVASTPSPEVAQRPSRPIR